MDIYMMYHTVWLKAFILAWPMVLSHIFTTAMRTTDMIIMGLFGPAAVTAVGLGDVWERIVLQIGLGFGTGSISLISQESGAETIDADRNTSEVLTQILLTGFLVGIPFILIGWFLSDQLIEILGAAPEVVILGAQYLLIIFSAAPFRIVGLIAARCLQGTGDTKTPMVVGIISNVVNIGLSIVLAVGYGPFPELGVVGVGWGTFFAKLIDSVMYTVIFLLPRTDLSLQMPEGGWNFTITRQLFKVSIPRILQGGYQSLITFPFNSLVLLFGTEAAAAYHIARRIQQQLMAPLQRAYTTVTTILSGQNLGRGEHEESRRAAKGMLWLTAITIGFMALIIFVFAPWIVRIFTDDQTTLVHSIGFLRTLTVGAFILSFYSVLSGVLTGAGDTRTPFYGVVGSQTIFKLGLSYILSIPLGLGLTGIFAGLIANFMGQTGWVLRRFRTSKWIEEAQKMIDERRVSSRL